MLFYVLFCVDCVVHVLFVCKSVLLPQCVNPIAVKYIIAYHICPEGENEGQEEEDIEHGSPTRCGKESHLYCGLIPMPHVKK